MNIVKKYPPRLFHSDNIQTAFKIASQTKFSSIFFLNQNQMQIIFTPLFNNFSKKKQKIFYGHLTRQNPIKQLLNKKNSVDCRLLFNEADVYISPTCYAAKKQTHNVVPTWNYVAAQFKGKMTPVKDQQLKKLLEQQVQIFESSVDSDWRLTDSTPEYIQKLLKGIFGIKIQVQTWQSHIKLSQNKQDQIENIKKWSQQRVKKQKNIVNWMQEFK